MSEQEELPLRIKPPSLEYPEDDPYRNDLFGRKEFGDALTGLLKRAEDNLVISIDAKWGDGKTTFADMWTRSLASAGYSYIYFDAYRHDHMVDPFVAFCAEIVRAIDREATADWEIHDRRERFVTAAGKAIVKVAGLGARFAMKGLLAWGMGPELLKAAKEAYSDEINDAAKAAGSTIENVVSDYVQRENAADEFKKQLQSLATAVKEKTGFPLVIVIDELDRCRPTFALELIERVKHYFDVPGLAFVVLANMDQLQQYVRSEYGDGVEAQGYLLKFFDLLASLPRRVEDAGHDDIAEFSRRLFSHFEIRDVVQGFLQCIFRRLDFTFREMEKCAAMVALHEAQRTESRFSHRGLVPLLAGLRVRDPALFARVARTGGTYDELENLFRFEGVPGNNSYATRAKALSNCLKCLYFTEEELERENAGRSEDERSVDGGKLDRAQYLNDGFWGGPAIKEIMKTLCRDLSFFVRREA